MEEAARTTAYYLSSIIEIIAMVIITIALFQFVYAYGHSFLSKQQHVKNAWLRVKFGSSLTIALELLLAADILATAVAPTWDDIGKLAAIAAIRTALNYFLEKEIHHMEKRLPSGSTEAKEL
jgi:uncharacterized membrane protein